MRKSAEHHSALPHASTATPSSINSYIGRFAPSPTGPLHFGSLIAAVASYLCARQNKGKWLLRIEDVDTQRKRKGATQSIIQTLDNYGFEWDGDIRIQSHCTDDYQTALDTLKTYIYPCSCTRKSLKASTGRYSYIYPGFCRDGINNNDEKLHKNANNRGGVLSFNDDYSIRLRTDVAQCRLNLNFTEQCQAHAFQQDLEKDVGDFILKRRDGLFAYQLAVVVDDYLQGVTDVVRGADLFDNTPRQNYLQCLLGYNHPSYLHFPVVVNTEGKKLSKQNLSPKISNDKKQLTLIKALSFLGQNPPLANEFSSLQALWDWAIENWNIDNIPKQLTRDIENYNE